MITAIILCAGLSSRMRGTDKISAEIGGKSVAALSVAAFDALPEIGCIVVALRSDSDALKKELSGFSTPIFFTEGGDTRQQSVRNALAAVPENTDYIAIHDGARPFVTAECIRSALNAARETGAAIAAVPVKDTIKQATDNVVTATPDRSSLFAAQTPQVFSMTLYKKALSLAQGDYTDDAQLIESTGGTVRLSDGDYSNIKITTPDDLVLAKSLNCTAQAPRVGHGYDVHRLVEGRRLILGGVEIPYQLGLLGHSDADVLTHAIADALLGAAALGDIGKHFPDNDGAFLNISSLKLLAEVKRLLDEISLKISNIDATVIAQRPKLAAYIPQMREELSSVLSIPSDCVSIKATTEEGLGFTGNGEGIAAHAVALLMRS